MEQQALVQGEQIEEVFYENCDSWVFGSAISPSVITATLLDRQQASPTFQIPLRNLFFSKVS